MRSVGLLQRALEAQGLATVQLNNNAEMTEKVCVPRAVFVQYPYGRIVGDVGDRAGQRKVCDAMVEWIGQAGGPNGYRHLPYVWPDPPEKVNWRPAVPAPIIEAVQKKQMERKDFIKALLDEERDGLD